MVLTDQTRQLICTNCKHPIYSEIHGVNGGSDENGKFVICSICGEKIYLNKKKEKE